MAAALAALLLTFAAPTTAEAQRFRFARLGLEDGLSQYSVYSLAQDAEGFLWIGTQNGLNRYDGRSFRYRWDAGAEPSPVSFGYIRTLFVDTSGRLWVGVDAHGLFLYERSREQFVAVPLTLGDGSLDFPDVVRDVTHLGDRVAVATSQGLGFVEDGDAGPVLRLQELVGVPPECGAATSALWAASDTEIWIGTPGGCLLSFEAASGGQHGRVLAKLDGVVRDIGRVTRGGAWVTVDGVGAYHFDRAGNLLSSPSPSAAATRRPGTLLSSTAGETWIATPGGLGWVPDENGDTTWFSAGTTENGELPHEYVSALLEDRQGVIWVGTWSGLARVSPFRRGIAFVPTPRSSRRPALSGVVAIHPVDGERVLVGMLGGGLATVELDGSGAREWDHPDMSDVYSLATGADGDLWVATNGSGVHRRTDDGWRSYREGVRGPGGSFEDRIAAVAVDRTGTVWVGTTPSGLGRYDPVRDRFEAFAEPEPNSAYAAPYVWPILEDAEGSLWFGANGPNGGIHRLSADRTELSTFPTGSPTHPNGGRVLTLRLGRDGVVWFGTQGGGLGRLEWRTGDIRFYTTADGLPHDNVQAILEDNAGKLWVSTNSGLARFDPETGQFWVFRERSGIQGSRFSANSSLKLADGRLLFGGSNGVSIIDPTHIAPRDEPPPVALTRFSVRGREIPEVNHVTAQDGVELQPDENFFTIEFAALDFTDATLNAYRYRLDDLDPDWIESATGNSASYTSVPPGRYVFRMQARNSEGVWNLAGLSIPILVRPPYYATWWFRLGIASLLAAIVWAVYDARSQQLARVRAMRLRITGDLHDDIGANLSAIALKSELLQRPGASPAKRAASLADIERLARETTQKVREMIWVVKEEHDTIAGLIERMRDAASNLLGGVVEYTFQVGDDVPEKQIPMELRQDVYRVFKEMLQNVLKHSGATLASIEVRWARSRLGVTVVDNGVGFVEAGVTLGNGLALMRRRAEKYRGAFMLEGAPGMGTRVTLEVEVR